MRFLSTILTGAILFTAQSLSAAPAHKVYEAWPFDATEAKRRQQETVKALGVPVKKSITLGKDAKGQPVTMDLMLIPAGKFLMGMPKPVSRTDRPSPVGPRQDASYTESTMVYTGRDPIEDGSLPSTASDAGSAALYFFPDQEVSELRARGILESGSLDERAWVISHLLRFAQWDDIWTYVSRDEVREIFPVLEMPENLQSAWAKMLKVEVPVG